MWKLCAKDVLEGKISEEVYRQQLQLAIFGCLAYVSTHGRITKLDKRTRPLIFVGYCADRNRLSAL